MRLILSLLVFLCGFNGAIAASHRDSAFTTNNPALNLTDLYAFTSYEAGREDYLTIIANFNPQISKSGPNYNLFDPSALYEIKIDIDGDAIEEITYRFRFKKAITDNGQGLLTSVDSKTLALPFINSASFTNFSETVQARELTYTVEYIVDKEAYEYKNIENNPVKGKLVTNLDNGSTTFIVAEANIGPNSIADYDSYADNFVYDFKLPVKDKVCADNAKVFVGPREESFKANLSGLYDLADVDLTGTQNGGIDEFAGTNVLSIALELPKACITMPKQNPSVIGVWASSNAAARRIVKNKPSFDKEVLFSRTAFVQSARAGNPLINLLLIGYQDKDLFNTTIPSLDERRFFDYIQYPVLAKLIDESTNLTAPNLFPRTDLEEVFLTGISGLNKPLANKEAKLQKSSDILRLNMETEPVAAASQNRLGVIAGDNAGYPNGRRPGDDVVDIFYRLLFGVRLNAQQAPSGQLALNDGVLVNASMFSDSFPYLNNPL